MAEKPILRQTVLDTTDVRALAEFYRELLGLRYRPGDEPPAELGTDDADWLVLRTVDDAPLLAFQLVDHLEPTTWPSHEVPMQSHLDLTVSNIEALSAARDRAVQLGGKVRLDRTDDPDEPLFVIADPAGHPFCIFVSDYPVDRSDRTGATGATAASDHAEPGREPVRRSAQDVAADADFLARYGDWDPLTPAGIRDELIGFDRPWWIIGGWAIEAATGYRREHEDLDISVLATDAAALVDHLARRWHVWNNSNGVLRPLGGGRPNDPEQNSQLWIRRDAHSPWVLDIPITPATGSGHWANKYLPDHHAPLEEVTWLAADGLRYLRPEIVLGYKARLGRVKDEPDFEAALPILDPSQRAWLRDALARLVPDHPWIERLNEAGSELTT